MRWTWVSFYINTVRILSRQTSRSYSKTNGRRLNSLLASKKKTRNVWLITELSERYRKHSDTPARFTLRASPHGRSDTVSTHKWVMRVGRGFELVLDKPERGVALTKLDSDALNPRWTFLTALQKVERPLTPRQWDRDEWCETCLRVGKLTYTLDHMERDAIFLHFLIES